MNIYYETKTLDGLLQLNASTTSEPPDATVILVGGKKLNLSEFPKLQGIFKTGVGTDNLPFDEAKERGIEIALPSPNTCSIVFRETASFASHLILTSLLRDTGTFSTWKKTPRRSLDASELLIIGTGRIGKIVQSQMDQFCKVNTYDSLTNSPHQLEPLIRTADCISIHLPLTPETRNFFDGEKLGWMKDGAAIVNTARGPIIDEQALYRELSTGRLFAALDVFSKEPYQGPLTDLPKEAIILTPHVASTCDEFLRETAKDFMAFVKKIEAKVAAE